EHICNQIGVDYKSIAITTCEYKDIPTYISISDTSVFFIASGFSAMAVSPTKQAEILSLGIPIIANKGIGDTDYILNSSSAGIVVEDFGADTLNSAAKQLLSINKTPEYIRKVAV